MSRNILSGVALLILIFGVPGVVFALISPRTISVDSSKLDHYSNKISIQRNGDSMTGIFHEVSNSTRVAYFGRGIWRFPWANTPFEVSVKSKDGVVFKSAIRLPLMGNAELFIPE